MGLFGTDRGGHDRFAEAPRDLEFLLVHGSGVCAGHIHSAVGGRFQVRPTSRPPETCEEAFSPQHSLPVELGNGFIRKREHWHHSMSERATWQALAASPVLTDFDLKRPTATLASVTQRMKAIPKTTYSAVGWENSLGVDYDALSGDATWDNVSWEHRRLCFQSFRQLVEEHGGDWKKLGNSFGSSFGVRKTYLYSDHPDLAGQGRPCDFKGYVLPAGP